MPTVTAQDSAGSGGSSEANVTLTDAVVRTAMGTRDNPRLLPTPRSNEANGVGSHGEGGADLRTTIDVLLPTPQAHDHVQGKTAGQVQAMRERTGAGVKNLNEIAVNELLPTPRATRGGSNTEIAYLAGGERSDERRQQGNVEIPEAAHWGPYAAAIHRWETVLGRPAPDPTEAGPKGGRRLSAAFVEWLMGLPEGWVTGHGLPRTAELKMLGNGVVPQQAERALRAMLRQTIMPNEREEATK